MKSQQQLNEIKQLKDNLKLKEDEVTSKVVIFHVVVHSLLFCLYSSQGEYTVSYDKVTGGYK